MSGTVILAGGRVIDPANGIDAIADVVIRDGVIQSVGEEAGTRVDKGVTVHNAVGKLVTPAWIDMHVHFRDPGSTEKESLESGARAAVAGGFGIVACMPNTTPALDSVEIVEEVIARSKRESACAILPIAAITRGRNGNEAVDFEALAGAGAIGFSDDGDTTADSAIMRRALEASRELNVPVIVHCEDKALAAGAMHEGAVSRRLGIQGIPAEAEEIIIARDLMLAELTGGWLHVCHVSTARGIQLIVEARERGVNVTAEVMPHHIVMSDEWVGGTRVMHNTSAPDGPDLELAHPYTKVNPPLRPVADTVGLLNAVKQGRFDIFATEQAPHADDDKFAGSYEAAAFGIIGIEFAFSCTHELVRAGHLTVSELVRLWTHAPASVFGLDRGTLTPGSVADVTVFDPEHSWGVSRHTIRSKSANTPMIGMTMRGRAELTLIDGEERYRA